MMSQVTRPPVEPASSSTYVWATGRRKTSVARVRIRPGTGVIRINGRDLAEYLPLEKWQSEVVAPLKATNTLGRYDIFVNSTGGGVHAQAGAIVLGIARALMKVDPTTVQTLRDQNFLTRDPREKERKKPGKRGARASFQFSKR